MNDRGAILIEVLVAVVILSIAALATVRFLATTARTQDRLRARELELRRAEQVLVRTALRTRAELDALAGASWEVDGLVMRVERVDAGLFRVALAPESAPASEILATLLHPPSASEVGGEEREGGEGET